MYICSTRNNITKSIETIIEVADESVLPAIESIDKISGFIKGYLSIQDEYEVLTNRVNSRHMTLAERELAFKKVKELRTDREAFIGLSTIITLVTLNIGTGGMATPAWSYPYFWVGLMRLLVFSMIYELLIYLKLERDIILK